MNSIVSPVSWGERRVRERHRGGAREEEVERDHTPTREFQEEALASSRRGPNICTNR